MARQAWSRLPRTGRGLQPAQTRGGPSSLLWTCLPCRPTGRPRRLRCCRPVPTCCPGAAGRTPQRKLRRRRRPFLLSLLRCLPGPHRPFRLPRPHRPPRPRRQPGTRRPSSRSAQSRPPRQHGMQSHTGARARRRRLPDQPARRHHLRLRLLPPEGQPSRRQPMHRQRRQRHQYRWRRRFADLCQRQPLLSGCIDRHVPLHRRHASHRRRGRITHWRRRQRLRLRRRQPAGA